MHIPFDSRCKTKINNNTIYLRRVLIIQKWDELQADQKVDGLPIYNAHEIAL